jgi:hypothetical protein
MHPIQAGPPYYHDEAGCREPYVAPARHRECGFIRSHTSRPQLVGVDAHPNDCSVALDAKPAASSLHRRTTGIVSQATFLPAPSEAVITPAVADIP